MFVELEDGGGVAQVLSLAFQALELEFAELVEGHFGIAATDVARGR